MTISNFYCHFRYIGKHNKEVVKNQWYPNPTAGKGVEKNLIYPNCTAEKLLVTLIYPNPTSKYKIIVKGLIVYSKL